MNPETRLQNKIRAHLEAAGAMVLRVAHGPVGFPDLIGCAPDGACFLIEVKRPGRPHPLSPIQARTLERWGQIARRGCRDRRGSAGDYERR